MFRIARFGGKFNRSKVKVWLYLAAVKANGKKGPTINQIHEGTGVPLFTLRRHMDKWWRWGRLNKRLIARPLLDGSTCLYGISASGERYLQFTVPEAFHAECLGEIKAWQEEKRAKREAAKAAFRMRMEAYKAQLQSGELKIVPNPYKRGV